MASDMELHMDNEFDSTPAATPSSTPRYSFRPVGCLIGSATMHSTMREPYT
jgi:hypothetical protein